MADRKILILAEGRFGVLDSKTATCVIRYAPDEVVAVVDSKTAGVRSVLPAHLRTYFAEAEAAGRSLPMAVAIGNDPFCTLASQIQTSIYTDELTFAGGLMGEPIELVKCVSIDVAVPATSEIVLEGEMVAGERHLEGPFGEYPGYYNPVRELPIFRLKAITHRRNPVFLAGLTGGHAMLGLLLHEGTLDVADQLDEIGAVDADHRGLVAATSRPLDVGVIGGQLEAVTVLGRSLPCETLELRGRGCPEAPRNGRPRAAASTSLANSSSGSDRRGWRTSTSTRTPSRCASGSAGARWFFTSHLVKRFAHRR